MVGPVDRAVWWIEHVMKNPVVYSISQFYQKSHKSAPNQNVENLARILVLLAIAVKLGKMKKD